MPQSLHQKYGHLIFSTKNRDPLISGDFEPRLYEYVGGIVRGEKATLLAIGGTKDHVHLVIRESKSIADQDFIGRLKGDSSRWVNQTLDLESPFAWQAEYGWFSIGPPDLEKAINYVKGQKEHHRKVTFQEEYRIFLEKYQVNYDEKYVWD